MNFSSKFLPTPKGPEPSLAGMVRKVPVLGKTRPSHQQVMSMWLLAVGIVGYSVFKVKKSQRKQQTMLALGTAGLAVVAAGLTGNA